MAGALEGIRVVDLTVWFQGPVAAQHLADFGAEVIKVERPQGGDQGRGVRSIRALPVGDWNQYFLVINRNKKSVALDLKNPRGREVMYRLVERSDVFLSNLGIELLERWELGYERLRQVNPRLIYATTTGYGRFGRVDKPSFDMTVQALTGLMARLGEPGQPPIYLGMGSGDAFGGLLAAMGILFALHHREQTGTGQWIDASLYGAQLFLTAPELQAYLGTGNEAYASQRSRRDPDNPLRNVYPARDRWVFVCAPHDDASWRAFAATLDRPGLADDPRFATWEQRRAHVRELVEILDAQIGQRTAPEWVARWRAAGVDAASVDTLADLAADPQAWENRYLMETWCEEVQRQVKIRGLPVELEKTPGEVRALGPELGQDTEMVLVETLGYSWEEVAQLKEAGAIP